MQRTKIVCPICGQEISKSNYTKHQRRHENHPETFKESIYHVDHEGLNCQYCGKECKNKNSLAQHELRCKNNPDRKDYIKEGFNSVGHFSWKKGLTKETDERVRRNSEAVALAMQNKVKNGFKPAFATEGYWTNERRLEQSIRKKILYQEHPEKHPNRKVASNSRRTYIEQVAYDWLVENKITFIESYETVFYDKKRFVDFYLPDYNLYIELDGEYWHSACKDVDNEKDRYAKEIQHINTIRISSKECIVDVLKNKLCGCSVAET